VPQRCKAQTGLEGLTPNEKQQECMSTLLAPKNESGGGKGEPTATSGVEKRNGQARGLSPLFHVGMPKNGRRILGGKKKREHSLGSKRKKERIGTKTQRLRKRTSASKGGLF